MRKSPNSNPLFLTTNHLKYLGSLSCTLLLFYCSACSASMFHKSSVKPPGIFRLLTMHRGSMSTWSLNHSSGLGRGPRHQIPSKSSWSTTLCFSPTQFTFWIEMFCSFCNWILVLILFILLFAKPTQRCTLRLYDCLLLLQTAPKDQLLQQHVREVNNARYMSTHSAASSLGSSSADRLGKIDKRKLGWRTQGKLHTIQGSFVNKR